MEIIGQIFIVIGIIIALIGGTMIVIQAFKTSLLWGFGSLIIPIVELIFIVMYWDKTKKYVIWVFLSLLFFMIGGTLYNIS
ncbi:hypothetical protein MNBD_IGNAVI01-579 [hydrothermal vent metagenome]|uniref:Uncharacterized protein n=1 Tax=hydrothermal vent metagenome TaxID=652676 RepID=A0A3B1CEU2_9ZZZZ